MFGVCNVIVLHNVTPQPITGPNVTPQPITGPNVTTQPITGHNVHCTTASQKRVIHFLFNFT